VNLADVLASGRATVKLEEIVRTGADSEYVLDVSRCVAYEQAAAGELPFVIRVGRRYLCSVPALLRMLQLPLPDDWQPSPALSSRCQCASAASDSSDLGSAYPKVDAAEAGPHALKSHEKHDQNDLGRGVRP